MKANLGCLHIHLIIYSYIYSYLNIEKLTLP